MRLARDAGEMSPRDSGMTSISLTNGVQIGQITRGAHLLLCPATIYPDTPRRAASFLLPPELITSLCFRQDYSGGHAPDKAPL